MQVSVGPTTAVRLTEATLQARLALDKTAARHSRLHCETIKHMAEAKLATRVNANFVIPDDPELSTYRFIIVAAKRARQLQSGQRSFLPTMSRKPTVVAMEETRRGLVQYHIPGTTEPGTEEES